MKGSLGTRDAERSGDYIDLRVRQERKIIHMDSDAKRDGSKKLLLRSEPMEPKRNSTTETETE